MNPSALSICRRDLYLDRAELMARYPLDTVEKILRVRDLHQLMISSPAMPARELVAQIRETYKISEATAYSDLKIVKELLPALTESKRSFHRWRANEMFLETYAKAKEKGDLKTMERTAADYAKYNRVDLEDEKDPGADAMPVQPFVPTMDPTVLGIAPIPNLQDKITGLLEKYSRETIDIEEVSYEEADLQEETLFPEDPAAATEAK